MTDRAPKHRTVTVGQRVTLGYGSGQRTGTIRGFVHDFGPTLEARIEWDDGLTTVVRLDALHPSHAHRKRKK